MPTVTVKAPWLLDSVLNESDFRSLQSHLQATDKSAMYYDAVSCRYLMGDRDPILKQSRDRLVPLAREVFGSNTLIPSYALFAHYAGASPHLQRHRDINACTYTIDLCIYQTAPWDLFVEDRCFTLLPNQAAIYFGNDQWHWRGPFPHPDTACAAMVFYHFVEPDHWFHTEGPRWEVSHPSLTFSGWP